jgi:hypothetical protein
VRQTGTEQFVPFAMISNLHSDDAEQTASCSRSKQRSLYVNKKSLGLPPALKHGCYSGLNLLPTEDRAAFDKLHRELITEYLPIGISEELQISRLAKYIWRRDNISTYVLAEVARSKVASIQSKLSPVRVEGFQLLGPKETRTEEELNILRKQIAEQIRCELGAARELVDLAVASTEHLYKEMQLIESLDRMIARCLKEFLLIRGVKSMAPSVSVEAKPKLKRIA